MKRGPRRCFLWVAACSALAPAWLLAEGERTKRVAFFSTQSLEVVAPRVDAFRQRLAEKGFVDGRNIQVRFFAPAASVGRDEAIAAMIAWKPDVIHAAFPPVIQAIRKATDRIPIVYRAVGDPIAAGFIASYARPGGNVTGVSSPGHLLIEKLLDFAREILPDARRLVILRDTSLGSVPGAGQLYANILAGARRRNFDCGEIGVSRHSNSLQAALEHAIQSRAELLMPYGGLPSVRGPVYPILIEFERRHRIPVLWTTAEVVRDGALMGYGFDVMDAVRLAANMVAAILRGASPAELPAETASRIELALNLATARELGIQFPKSVLVRADRVVP